LSQRIMRILLNDISPKTLQFFMIFKIGRFCKKNMDG
jgi:hypothetical protein